MKNEARVNEASDKAEREKIDKINQADSLIFQTEKQLKEYGEKIPADKKAPIETALNKLKEAHKSQDLSAIDAATTEMNNAWTAASEELYKATQGDQAGGGQQPGGGAGGNQQQPGNGGNGGENVTDAEYEEVK
jgi:molecular chaperone DnaK